MRAGELRVPWEGAEVRLICGPDGWSSPDSPKAAAVFAAWFPPPPTACGAPWGRAFWSAVQALGATVVQEPEADDVPGGVVASPGGDGAEAGG